MLLRVFAFSCSDGVKNRFIFGLGFLAFFTYSWGEQLI